MHMERVRHQERVHLPDFRAAKLRIEIDAMHVVAPAVHAHRRAGSGCRHIPARAHSAASGTNAAAHARPHVERDLASQHRKAGVWRGNWHQGFGQARGWRCQRGIHAEGDHRAGAALGQPGRAAACQ